MWKNYLLTSIRAFKKDKFYISSNILSLAVAFALCIIGYFNYGFNSSFNEYFSQTDEIYKINSLRAGNSDEIPMGISPSKLKDQISQFENTQSSRFQKQHITVKNGDQLFEEGVAFVDPEFMEIFDFQLIKGKQLSTETSHGLILNDETALKYFNKKNVVGEMLTLMMPGNNPVSFQVIGVIQKPPSNISFHFGALAVFETYSQYYNVPKDQWNHWVDGTFVKTQVPKTACLESLNSILDIQNKQNKDLEVASYTLDSITEWPAFASQQYKGHFMGHLHPASVLGTISAAITILLLACFNYINISLTLSTKRLKEIGIRKMIGGQRGHIITQIIVENILSILVAIFLSIGISYLIIPAYNALFDIELIDFARTEFLQLIIFSIIVFTSVIILSSIYPALYVSKFDSLSILKNSVKFSSNNVVFKVLLSFQFLACFYNVFALLAFYQNSKYQLQLDRGYTINNTVNIPLSTSDQYLELSQSLKKVPGINTVCGTKDLVGFSSTDKTISYASNDIRVSEIQTGKDYMQQIGIRLEEGSFLNREYKEGQNEILINQMLNEELGGNMLHQNLTINQKKLKVIGIVEDFNLKPIMLTNKIRPTVISLIPKTQYQNITITSSKWDAIELNEKAEEIWYAQFPNQLYRGFTQEKVFRPLNQTNNIILHINTFIAIAALLITALGLYTLISLSIQKRIKEFGIRKVLGASAITILKIINKQLIWVIGISGTIGLVVGYIVIQNLLDIIYAYHMEISWLNFVVPVLLMFIIIVLSIGQKVISTAKLNPTTQLRME